MVEVSDSIRKRVVLQAPLERVWRAISDHREFGAWFGVRVDTPFTPGTRVTGVVTPTTVDPQVAEAQKQVEGTPWSITVDRVEPMRLFSFRWHPYAVDPDVDYSDEPTTLVTFELRGTPEGTELTITESGFDAIPLQRRAEAFSADSGGWDAQSKLIAKYLALAR